MNSALYEFSENICSPGRASSERISRARTPPAMKKPNATAPTEIPIRL